MTPAPHLFPTTKGQRSCRRVLRMVSELHARGYQKIRICPQFFSAGDGLDWSCTLRPRADVSSLHGARGTGDHAATFASDMARRPFGWDGMEHATPSQLAEQFLRRFPEIASRGLGMDWEYASWYALMTALTFPGALPVADHPSVNTDEWLIGTEGAQGGPPALIPRPQSGDHVATRVGQFAAFAAMPEAAQLRDERPATGNMFGRPKRLPSVREPLRYVRWLPDEYFRALSIGFVPQMDDKWFAYVQGKTLHLHRGCNGFCIWTVHFEALPRAMGGGYLAVETFANRDRRQMPQPFPDELRLLDQLVVNLARRNLQLHEY